VPAGPEQPLQATTTGAERRAGDRGAALHRPEQIPQHNDDHGKADQNPGISNHRVLQASPDSRLRAANAQRDTTDDDRQAVPTAVANQITTTETAITRYHAAFENGTMDEATAAVFKIPTDQTPLPNGSAHNEEGPPFRTMVFAQWCGRGPDTSPHEPCLLIDGDPVPAHFTRCRAGSAHIEGSDLLP
jgi:hypothetical protein